MNLAWQTLEDYIGETEPHRIASVTGFDRRSVNRARKRGTIPLRTGERIADTMRVDPAEIWPEYVDVVLAITEDKVARSERRWAARVCPTCGFPMAWSETRGREWCSVYGDHPKRPMAAVVRLCMEAPNNSTIASYARHVRAEQRRRSSQRNPQVSTEHTQRNPHGCASSDPQPGDWTITA